MTSQIFLIIKQKKHKKKINNIKHANSARYLRLNVRCLQAFEEDLTGTGMW